MVQGIVQGVGFRPFIHRIARAQALSGAVRNFTGGVEIEVEGPAAAVAAFGEALIRERPPIAVIDEVRAEDLEPTGETDFVILPSREEPAGQVFISPDIAVCGDCVRELLDPADRRYHYPFINCTNCGPRYTITSHVPYDRPNTSMAAFAMCEYCAREYHDVEDRRYHAQPVACPVCGPRLEFVGGEAGRMGPRTSPIRPLQAGREVGEAALREAIAYLKQGKVVAIKGLGGFHLACDATNEAAVRELRRRKGREEKPFAAMAGSLAELEGFVEVSEETRGLLSGPRMPIVLAPKRLPERLALSVAPGSSDYGVMLPYTPLHHLLLAGGGFRALVMTSGNLSEEPLCTDNEEARRRLGGIADGFLLHDRDILVGCDDSVLRWSRRGPIALRRARGYVPFPVRLAEPARPVLAVGGHLKNTVCLTAGRGAALSQHIGDLENEATLNYFERIIAHLQEVLQVAPEAIACDLHPGYLSTRWAEAAAARLGLPLVAVQHHHAHIVACMADNGVSEPVIGLACDGTGYGEDGTVWGCEVLLARLEGAERLGHLREARLPGGEAAVREPWRMAAAYLREAYGPDFGTELPETVTRNLDLERWEVLARMLERGINSPVASSAGRLFDAVAALAGLCGKAAFEGQAAMALEAAAEPAKEGYPYEVRREEGGLILDPLPAIRAIVDDLRAGASVGTIAGRFHEGFARMLLEAARSACEASGLSTVALSGGTFQNRVLLERLCDLLEGEGLRALHHRAVPPNDGGLALGQAVAAEARLRGAPGPVAQVGDTRRP